MADDRPDFSALAEAVIRKRQADGLTQKELAARVGVDQRTISNYEQGHFPRTADEILRVTRKIGLDEADVRRLLFKAWKIEEKPDKRQLSAEERALIDLYATNETARELIRAVVEKFGTPKGKR